VQTIVRKQKIAYETVIKLPRVLPLPPSVQLALGSTDTEQPVSSLKSEEPAELLSLPPTST
jgi:hypothetical protein